MIALVAAALAMTDPTEAAGLTPAPADPRVTVGWGVGVDARLGKGAVFVGAGAGPSVTVALSEHLDAHAEVRWLTLAGSTWLVRGGVGARLPVGVWRPGVGLDATGYLGATLRAVTAENPDLAGDTALAIQLRLDPLRFQGGRWTAEVLRVEIGAGWDRGLPAVAFGVTVAEV
ncbi:MAG: hypothetical protein ACK4YP_02110, partial [Myxococcota bacterium]